MVSGPNNSTQDKSLKQRLRKKADTPGSDVGLKKSWKIQRRHKRKGVENNEERSVAHGFDLIRQGFLSDSLPAVVDKDC